MIPEYILKLAEERGYKRERYYFDENGSWDYVPESDLLNPLFWKALGKAKGWHEKFGSKILSLEQDPSPYWRDRATYFFYLLMTNGNLEEFWKSI